MEASPTQGTGERIQAETPAPASGTEVSEKAYACSAGLSCWTAGGGTAGIAGAAVVLAVELFVTSETQRPKSSPVFLSTSFRASSGGCCIA